MRIHKRRKRFNIPELIEANERAKQSLECVMRIYEVIDLSLSDKAKQEVIGMIQAYISKILGINKQMIVEYEVEQMKWNFYAIGLKRDEEQEVLKALHKSENIDFSRIKQFYIREEYMVFPICYTYELLGFLMVPKQEITKDLIFTSQILELILKKFRLKKLDEDFLISEEKNRIANEIHDSILQQLFGINCGLYAFSKKLENIGSQELVEELNGKRQVIQTVMKNLKQIVYGMSWNKDGDSQFLNRIRNYIAQGQEIYDIPIKLEIGGDVQFLDYRQQGILYRFLCEGIANSLKHSRATLVQVKLSMTYTRISLSIKDNGCGFNYSIIKNNENVGIGIKNMEYLIECLGGELEIESSKEMGTEVKAEIFL